MKKRKVLLAFLVVILAGGLAWAFLPASPDPQVAKVAELQEKLFADGPPNREAFEELRREMDKLSPAQRDQMMRDHPPPFMRRMQQNIVAYFDLPEDERVAALDKQIDEMEAHRKEFEKRRAQRRDRGPRRGGFGRNADPAQQNQMRKRMLDNTSPQQRAMFGEYFRQIQHRRQQRGLPPMHGPGPGGPPPPH